MRKLFKKAVSALLAALLLLQAAPVFAVELPEDYYGYVFDDYDTGKMPDLTFTCEGVLATVEELPDENNKSLAVKTQTGATQFYIDLPLISGKNECVIETSIAYKGTLASYKNIFTVGGTDDAYLVFMSLSSNGALKLFDGTVLSTLTEGVFCDIVLTINFENQVCSVKVDGKTRAIDVPLVPTRGEKLADADNVRMQMSSITGDTETFYINYFYAKGEKAEADTGTSVPQPDKVVVTNTTMKKRMANHILMTTKNGKALVNNAVKEIDPDNPQVAPTIVNGRTMVPLRFIAESFGAKVAYDTVSEQATITFGETVIKVTGGSAKYFVNDEEKNFDVPPINVGGRLLVPIRAVAENFGKGVFWDKCGYILIGDDAESYNLNNVEDKKTLDLAARNLLFDSVTSEDVLAAFDKINPNGEHPRLMLRAEDLPPLRQKVATDPQAAKYMESVIALADGYLVSKPFVYGQDDPPRMYSTCFAARKRIETLAFTYLVTEDIKYARGAIDTLINVCDPELFPDWNPYHFLDVGTISSGVALGYDWCYNVMTEEERKIVEEALWNNSVKEIMKDFTNEAGIQRTFRWNLSSSSSYPQNWVIICAGGCAVAAMAIADIDEYASTAADVISMGLENIKDLIAEFSPDGAWHEGPGYWVMCYEYFAFAFSSYQTALGTDFGLLDAPGLHDGGYYFVGINNGPLGTFNLSSTDRLISDCPEIYWLADTFDDPTLAVWRKNYLDVMTYSPGWRDVLWYRPDLSGAGMEDLTLDGMWRKSNISSTRTGFNESDLYVAFHGADYQGDTSDLDSGTFILDMFGVRWAYESGKEIANYIVGSPYSRHQRYRSRGEGHNTMVFNPGLGVDLNPYAISPIIRHEYNDLMSISVSDLTAAHSINNVSRVRGIMVDKAEKYVIVQDEFKAAEPAEFYWFMHTEAEDLKVSEDGKSAVLMQDNKKMLVKLLGDSDYSFEKMSATPLPTSPTTSDMSDDSNILKLAIHAENVSEDTISVAIVPLAGAETDAEILYTPIPIDSWKLKDKTVLPSLTSLKIGGEEVNVVDGQAIYSYKVDPYNAGGSGYEVTAEGDGDIEITQISSDNNVARISVTKDGVKNNYYIELSEVGVNDISFEPQASVMTLMGVSDVTKLNVQSVYASHVPQPENSPENTIDGDLSTRFSSDVYGTTIDFDLGSVQKINKVGVAFGDGNKRSTRFRIAVSEDGKSWKGVKDILTAPETNEVVLYDIGEQNARYVRLIGYGNTSDNSRKWFSPTEIGIYSN